MMTRFIWAAALVLGNLASCSAQPPIFEKAVEPADNMVFTPSREVRALRVWKDELWVATGGGVLRFKDGWTKWSRKNGLPSNEAFDLSVADGKISVRFPVHTATFDGTEWTSEPATAFQKKATTVDWNGQKATATLDGLQVGGKSFPNPPAEGTHITALLPSGKSLLAAFYGDGLWRFDGATWKPDALNVKLTPETKEITALVSKPGTLIIGTRRAGVWSNSGGKWQPVGSVLGTEIFNANVQNMGMALGQIWGSTLDDGLVVRTGSNWARVTSPTLSTTAPRQMVEWNNQLFVRHGSGVVDSFDGSKWTKNALATIPRKGVYALDKSDSSLFAAGWGGWSEWDGSNWTPHFEVPELKGVPLMGLLVDGDTLWIATQSRGLGRYDRSTAAFRWLDERDGLPDDWITTLIKLDGHVYAGTFVGGLARLDGEKWKVYDELKGQNVTALAADGDSLIAATRSGIWRIKGDTAEKILKPWLDNEVQSLVRGENGLWVGARTSLNYLKLGLEQKNSGGS